MRTAALAATAASVLALGLGAAPASAQTPGTSYSNFHIFIGPGQKFCLDVPGGNAVTGAQVEAWGCNGTPAQVWDGWYVDTTHYQLAFHTRDANGNQLCLNHWEGGDVTGNHLRLYPCSKAGSPDDAFNTVFNGGNTQIQPKVASSNCLNIWGGLANGNPARLYQCADVDNENLSDDSAPGFAG
ncbi:RICIN domain-containing protein [Streptomyces sp. NRAIS4]